MNAKWIFAFLTIAGVSWSSCSKLDNYERPSGTLFGKLIDATTQQPLLTEQPNGFRIRYIEQNYINPNVSVQNFHGKADGTFERGVIPAATYKVLPIEGAFFPLTDTATVTVAENGRSEVNFTVVPYLTLSAQATVSGSDVVLTYTISRAKAADKIVERKALCSLVPTVSNTVSYKSVSTNTTTIPDEEILSTTYTDVIRGLPSGTYWVRAAARTKNANNRFNYSPVFQIQIP